MAYGASGFEVKLREAMFFLKESINYTPEVIWKIQIFEGQSYEKAFSFFLFISGIK